MKESTKKLSTRGKVVSVEPKRSLSFAMVMAIVFFFGVFALIFFKH